jgi:hypothetical protein
MIVAEGYAHRARNRGHRLHHGEAIAGALEDGYRVRAEIHHRYQAAFRLDAAGSTLTLRGNRLHYFAARIVNQKLVLGAIGSRNYQSVRIGGGTKGTDRSDERDQHAEKLLH